MEPVRQRRLAGAGHACGLPQHLPAGRGYRDRLEAATYDGARAPGLACYGLAIGAPADLVVLAADTAAAAVVTRPIRDLVLKAGRVVVRGGRLS